ncbi:cytochrome P450 [Alicyclobacillus macrosporangiidus]|uniref:cytochrome P450 n=1 Tax=Alicyclobacillus macrosporangiidus TaxID=392015 RepID=UPI0009DD57F4|nr:cytochrome P450 [Alicyclobacillus macrosporangiidus]
MTRGTGGPATPDRSGPPLDAGHIPGPPGHWLLGHVGAFRTDALGFLTQVRDTYGDVAQLRFGRRRVFVLANPAYIREVLVEKPGAFRKDRALQLARRVLGDGLLTSEGETHRRHRRMMQPAFHARQVSRYADAMVEAAERLAEGWRDGEERLLSRDMMDVTLRIIARTMFGYQVPEETEEIGRAIDTVIEAVIADTLAPVRPPDWWPSRRRRAVNQAIRTLDGVVYRIIGQRRKASEAMAGPESAADEGLPTGVAGGDLLSMLLAARDETDGSGMTDAEVRDQVMTIFLAGHETTANTLSWTWHLLAHHPEAERKLHAELDRVLGDRAPTLDDLPHLPYVTCVVRESMRLLPAAWTLGYEAVEDVTIGPWRFRRGDTLLMSQYLMHRHPKYFEEPDAFLPERWENDFIKTLPPFVYFPFGGGPRVCIGNQFALLEAQLLVAAFARRWRFEELAEPIVVPQPLITLRPRYGIRMRVWARHTSGGAQDASAG